MICKQCGEENNERFTYCTGCGASLKSSQPPPAEQSFQSPVATAGSEKAAIARQRLAQAQREQWERLAGEILDGKYRLNSVLEIDPSGATYRATRLKIEDEVAVKIFNLGEEADVAASADGFFRAAQKAARFKHRNAPAIYDFDLGGDNRFYVVTELVAGESLRRIIKERKTLPPQIASAIADEVCDALGEAHRAGLIHGDIRPRNIVVNFAPAGGGLRATVLNFGLGNFLGARANDPKNPVAAAAADAWRYLSPEQCLGEEIDNRSDIYGFGIVLYEMLGGAPPFDSANPTAVAVQHVTKSPVSLRALNPNVPPPIETVVMRALEKEKEARQQTAAELARELRSAVFGAATANRTSSSGEFASNKNPPPANASATGSFVPASSIPAGHSAPVFGGSSPGVNSDLQLPPPVSLRGDNAIAPPTFASNLSYRENGSGKFFRIVGFALLLAFLAATVAALFRHQATENGSAGESQNTVIRSETNTGDNASPGANDPGGKGSAASSGADVELKRLRAESDKSVPREKKSALESDFKNAENRYPEDYRFTYQRAKLEAATSKSHHEAFEMLFQAGEKAIKDGKSADLLNDLQSDGSSILKRLTDHKEWKVLENALRKNDSKTLAESGH